MLPSEMDAKNTICKCTLSELQNIRFSGKYSLKNMEYREKVCLLVHSPHVSKQSKTGWTNLINRVAKMSLTPAKLNPVSPQTLPMASNFILLTHCSALDQYF